MSNQLSFYQSDLNNIHSKFTGAFVGSVIGDAMGFITEFTRDSKSLQKIASVREITSLLPWFRPTKHNYNDLIYLPLPEGTYSDDTQLTIATARSLRSNGTFDPVNFSKLELPLWVNYQLGGGVSTKAAARNLTKKSITWYNNFFETKFSNYTNSGGNGAAMRILPIILVNLLNTSQQYKDIWRNVIITHGHPRALIGALLFSDSLTLIIKEGIHKYDILDHLAEKCYDIYPNFTDFLSDIPEFHSWKESWEEYTKSSLEEAIQDTCIEATNQLKIVRDLSKDPKNFKKFLSAVGCFDRETKGSGLGTVIAAIYSFIIFDDITDALTSLVNQFGIDTDTIGYLTGALFGAREGIDMIPKHLSDNIQDRQYISNISDWCYSIHKQSNDMDVSISSLIDTSNKSLNININKIISPYTIVGDFIELPLLGKGVISRIENISPNNIEDDILWITIKFEIGQTIFLKYIKPKILLSKPTKEKIYLVRTNSEANTIEALSVLDQYKEMIISNDFQATTIIDVVREIKHVKKDRALYTAFCTWLWGTIPE
jgi:ADP-ribosylglycohydrolase